MPGERVWLLDIPFAERGFASAHRARWHTGYGWTYVGTTLPDALKPYLPSQYSWLAWLQHDLNKEPPGDPKPDLTTGDFTLRPDQEEDVHAVLTAKRLDVPEFLIASDVGVGKTVTTIAAVKRMPGVRNVLVLAPLGVLPQWREHLRAMGDGGKRWCLVNYESNKKLLTPPPSAQAAKRRRTKNQHTARQGVSRVQWDVVVTDEGDTLANPDSQQSLATERLIAGPGEAPAFPIRLTATAGDKPTQLAYLHRGLFAATGHKPRRTITLEQYAAWCESQGIHVQPGRFGTGLDWDPQERDLATMHRILYRSSPQWGLRRVRDDWPEKQRIPVPVELTAPEREAYERDWAEFAAAMRDLAEARKRAGTGPHTAAKARALATARARGLVAQTRYRQKAGLLRAEGVAQFVAVKVSSGFQVAVACAFSATVDALEESLRGRGIAPARFTGENRETRDEQRIAYQRGEHPVILFTPARGLNLHAGEAVVGGNDTPRLTVVAEPRWSPRETLQIEGRSHRDGTNAPTYYTYATDTIEQHVIRRVIEGMARIGTLNGDTSQPFEGIAAALGVPLVIGEGAASQ